MADVFKPTYHRAVPATAKVFVRSGKKFARFSQGSGRIVEGELLPGGKKCRVEAPHYYARIRDSEGRVRRVPLGVADKEAARQLRARLQLEADQQKAGLIDPMAGHRRRPLIGSMKSLPKQRHDRNERGQIVRFAGQLQREDLERAIEGSHLADYRAHLQGAGRSSDHICEVARVIRRVCIACKFQDSSNLDANVFDRYLAGLIATGKSYRTRNAALKSVRAFVRWMVKSDRLLKDPLKTLSAVNEEADPNRRHRRALDPNEFARLTAAAECGLAVESVSGLERAMLYLLAAWTGLRRKELAALTTTHLSLIGDPPFVHVPAASTKAKRDDQPIPLHPFVAERLRGWIAERNAKGSDRIFHLATRSGRLRKTSKMMEHDCTAAGIDYVGDLGVANFHSHRVAFITHLCRTADFSTVVDLARHSDPKLTAKTYDRVRLENRVAAINGLSLPAEMLMKRPLATS